MTKQLELKEIPRIIYLLKPEFTVKGNFNPVEELDGVFYSDDEKILNIEGLPFIIDNKMWFNDQELIFRKKSNEKDIIFNKNSLILFEVKNRFSGTSTDSAVNVELKEELLNLFSKVSIFYQINIEKYTDLENVQIFLFYDTIPKEGYEDILKQAFYDYFKDKINFHLKFNFNLFLLLLHIFAYNTKNLMDKIKFLELKIKENENNLLKKNSDLKEIIDKLKLEEKIKTKK